jgi:crossover junction endodeoxyribonuclease RuvC
MSIWIGIDPGSVSGAVGALDPNGDYLDSFMIEHQDKHILPMVFKNMILRLVDPKEGAEICCELVHSMPNQGVASTFQFGRAVGVITAVCTLTNYPLHMVSPQKWKKHFHLSSDKGEALDCARMLWPQAPLKRKKDINIAESLLIAEYWRDCINGKIRDKSPTR